MQTNAAGRRELELAVGERVNALVSATRALGERSAARFHAELQPAAFHIARWLHAFGPARPSAVAAAVAMDRSSTSTLLRKMRTLGLTYAEPDPDDRRGAIVGLTEEGEARVVDALQDRGAEFFARLRDWQMGDLRDLERLLAKLTAE